MEPTIKNGQYVTVDREAYKVASPQRWDVVLFTHPQTHRLWCARVVGLPGEIVDIRSEALFISGTNMPLPSRLRGLAYTSTIPGLPGTVSFPFAVPKDACFVLGDNTKQAWDSRFWGALAAADIAGRVAER